MGVIRLEMEVMSQSTYYILALCLLLTMHFIDSAFVPPIFTRINETNSEKGVD